jgi:hypothetical protein
LPTVAKCVGADANAVREAVARDLDALVPDADAYQRRLHTATVLRALREMHAR